MWEGRGVVHCMASRCSRGRGPSLPPSLPRRQMEAVSGGCGGGKALGRRRRRRGAAERKGNSGETSTLTLRRRRRRRRPYRRRPLRPSMEREGGREGGEEKQLNVKLPIKEEGRIGGERDDFKWVSHNICFFFPHVLIVFSYLEGRRLRHRCV